MTLNKYLRASWKKKTPEDSKCGFGARQSSVQWGFAPETCGRLYTIIKREADPTYFNVCSLIQDVRGCWIRIYGRSTLRGSSFIKCLSCSISVSVRQLERRKERGGRSAYKSRIRALWGTSETYCIRDNLKFFSKSFWGAAAEPIKLFSYLVLYILFGKSKTRSHTL